MMRPASGLVPGSEQTRRGVLWLCAATIVGHWILAWLPVQGPAPAAARLLAGFCAMGVVPGIVVALAVGRFRHSVLVLLAHGAALSLGLAQVLCLVSLTAHVSTRTMAAGIGIGSLLLTASLLLGWRRAQAPLVYFPVRERWLLGALGLVAAVLYPKGSVILAATYEDMWHLSVINRLTGSVAAGLTGTFVEPDMAFTHPVPGMHYFLSLVSHASGEWPLLVYNKARCFWAVLSLAFAYVTASRLFPARRAATFVVVALGILIVNGTFGDTGWHWGQGAPQSHNTDIVMGVIVPGIVAMLASWYYGIGGRRLVSLLALLALLVTVVFAHVREAPQALLYLVAWAVAAACARDRRAWQLLAMAGGLAVAILLYGRWHAAHAPLIKDFIANRRAVMMAMMSSMHGWDWWRESKGVYPLVVLWQGWHPLLIVLAPLVLARWGRRSAAWAVAAIFLAALLMIRVPALSLGASLVTYDEILMFPVRFFTPFTCLVPGLVAWRLSRLPSGVFAWGAALVAIGVGVACYGRLEPVLVRQPDIFFGAAFLAVGVGLAFGAAPRPIAPGRAGDGVAWGFLAGLAVVTFQYRFSPLNWRTPAAPTDYLANPNQAVWTGADVLRTFRIYRPPGPGAAPSHPPPFALVNWLHRQLSPDAVLITNPDSHYVLTAFAPQHQMGWCYLRWLLDTRLGRVFGRDGAWPFFDSTWSDRRRWEFCREQGITTVLIDPALSALVKTGFAESPELFQSLYAADGWRVYQVRASEPHAGGPGR
jgi:hypothetical protein